MALGGQDRAKGFCVSTIIMLLPVVPRGDIGTIRRLVMQKLVRIEKFEKSGWVFTGMVSIENAKDFVRLNPWGYRIRSEIERLGASA